MTRTQFRELSRQGRSFIPRSVFSVSVPSATDPTQDVPVSRVFSAMTTGVPLDIHQNPMSFNALHAEDLSSLEKKNNDSFDVFAESRNVQKGLDKQIKNIVKSQNSKQNEE